MGEITQMMKEARTVKSVFNLSEQDGSDYHAGKQGVTEIVVYGEPGEYGTIPWVAVKKGDAVVYRVAAHYVSLMYYPD